nr:PREDICTED: CMRF35-like molecule 1 isoform X2 [Rhinolophus sinicus]
MYLLLLFPLLCLLSGSNIHGPASVRGPEQGSLTVQCCYDPEWKTYVKWWCRGAVWGSCKILVKTAGSEWQKDRVSIRDNQTSHIFTVTMKELRQDDADTYWCGIQRTGTDLGVQVVVTIDPATTTVSTTPTTSTATSTNNMFTAEVAPENTTDIPTVTSHHSDGSGHSIKLYILLPIFFAVLLLLLVAASILAWRMVKRQKKAAGTAPEQVVQPLENDICYANLTLTQTGTFPSSSRKEAFTRSRPSAQKDQEEVEYVTMAPFPNEDICYATVSLDTSDQEPTYSNMDGLISDLPNRSDEGLTEYSAIRVL